MRSFFLFFTLLFTSFTLAISPGHSASPQRAAPLTDFSGLKSAERQMLYRMVSFSLLQEVRSKLEAVIQKGDEKALAELLQPWQKDDRAALKKDLLEIKEKLSFRISANSLFMSFGEGEVQFEVIDPIAGQFEVNGKKITIPESAKYEYIKKKMLETGKVSAFSPFSYLLPEANAAAPIAIAACARFCAPVLTAAGGFVKNHALPAAWSATRFVATEAWGLARHVVYTGFFACMLSSQVSGYSCKDEGAKLLCMYEKKPGCVGNVGDLKAEIVQANDQNASNVTVIQPLEDGKCIATQAGFRKGLSIQTLSVEDLKAVKAPNASLPPPIVSSELHLEYDKNPEDPKKLSLKTITEMIRLKNGEIDGKRIWTFTGSDFKVDYFDKSSMLINDKLPKVYQRAPQKVDCQAVAKKSEACQSLIRDVLAPLGNNIDCPVENPGKVIEEIKATR